MAVIEAIATTYLEADAASVTFSSIPATYEHLQVRMSVLDSVAGTGYYYIRLNGDTAANYTNHRMTGTSTTTGAAANAGQTYNWSPYLPTIDEGAANYGTWVIDILDYANANKNTTIMWTSGSAAVPAIAFGSGLWDDTDAVDEIWLAADNGSARDWQRGSEFTLYGLNSS